MVGSVLIRSFVSRLNDLISATLRDCVGCTMVGGFIGILNLLKVWAAVREGDYTFHSVNRLKRFRPFVGRASRTARKLSYRSDCS